MMKKQISFILAFCLVGLSTASCTQPKRNQGLTAQSFTQNLIEHTTDSYNKNIKDNRFISDLVDGSLPMTTFINYLVQDLVYLMNFYTSMMMLASQAPNDAIKALLEDQLKATMDEIGFEVDLMAEAAGDDADAAMANTPINTINNLYANHLLASAANDAYLVGLTALFPCYWDYTLLGQDLQDVVSTNPIYQQWIAHYQGTASSTQALLAAIKSEAHSIQDRSDASAIYQEALNAAAVSSFFDAAFFEAAYDVDQETNPTSDNLLGHAKYIR